MKSYINSFDKDRIFHIFYATISSIDKSMGNYDEFVFIIKCLEELYNDDKSSFVKYIILLGDSCSHHSHSELKYQFIMNILSHFKHEIKRLEAKDPFIKAHKMLEYCLYITRFYNHLIYHLKCELTGKNIKYNNIDIANLLYNPYILDIKDTVNLCRTDFGNYCDTFYENFNKCEKLNIHNENELITKKYLNDTLNLFNFDELNELLQSINKAFNNLILLNRVRPNKFLNDCFDDIYKHNDYLKIKLLDNDNEDYGIQYNDTSIYMSKCACNKNNILVKNSKISITIYDLITNIMKLRDLTNTYESLLFEILRNRSMANMIYPFIESPYMLQLLMQNNFIDINFMNMYLMMINPNNTYEFNNLDNLLVRNYFPFFFNNVDTYDYYANELCNDIIDNKMDHVMLSFESTNELINIIQRDDVHNFCVYITIHNININKEVSIDQTQKLFIGSSLDTTMHLISLAAYYGAYQIFFRLLEYNNIYIPNYIMRFAMHGNNAEIVHMLEEKFEYCNTDYETAITSYNIDFVKYLQDNHQEIVKEFNDISNFYQ